MKKKFDKALMKLYIKNGYSNEDFGYDALDFDNKVPNQQGYEDYFSKKNWINFLNKMKENPKAYNAYIKGGGSETIEKYSKKYGVWYPPKMASVASSSRFIYATFQNEDYKNKVALITGDIEDGEFRFEHKLKIRKLKSAFLDASYITKSKDRAIFFEAKCHEIFDSKKIEFPISYYHAGVLQGNKEYSLQIKNIKLIGDNAVVDKSEFNLDDNKLVLDIKQFISHLLAIANCDLPNAKKELVYFYFYPKGIKELDWKSTSFIEQIERKYNDLEKQFNLFCSSDPIKNFCKRYHISLRLVYSVNETFESDLKVDNRCYFNYCEED